MNQGRKAKDQESDANLQFEKRLCRFIGLPAKLIRSDVLYTTMTSRSSGIEPGNDVDPFELPILHRLVFQGHALIDHTRHRHASDWSFIDLSLIDIDWFLIDVL